MEESIVPGPGLHVRIGVHGSGSLVAILEGASEVLIGELRAKGVEILEESSSVEEGIRTTTHIVYPKLYSEEEQIARDCGLGFHQGYTLASFFLAFPRLLTVLDSASVEEYKPFLDSETLEIVRREVTTCSGSGENEHKDYIENGQQQPPRDKVEHS